MITSLFNTQPGQYRLINGIYSFIQEDALQGDNRKFNQMYDRIAWSYHLSQRIYFFLKYGSEWNFRKSFLTELDIHDGDKVLEISTGTADNFRFLNKNAFYVGADISMGMLKQARRHCKNWKLNYALVHCEGEHLPFKDHSFDVVFHCGGINYFNDKKKAISEMARVAKPGTRLLIVDETDKLVRENYKKNPFLKKYFSEDSRVDIPVSFVPENIPILKSAIICKGLMYQLVLAT